MASTGAPTSPTVGTSVGTSASRSPAASPFMPPGAADGVTTILVTTPLGTLVRDIATTAIGRRVRVIGLQPAETKRRLPTTAPAPAAGEDEAEGEDVTSAAAAETEMLAVERSIAAPPEENCLADGLLISIENRLLTVMVADPRSGWGSPTRRPAKSISSPGPPPGASSPRPRLSVPNGTPPRTRPRHLSFAGVDAPVGVGRNASSSGLGPEVSGCLLPDTLRVQGSAACPMFAAELPGSAQSCASLRSHGCGDAESLRAVVALPQPLVLGEADGRRPAGAALSPAGSISFERSHKLTSSNRRGGEGPLSPSGQSRDFAFPALTESSASLRRGRRSRAASRSRACSIVASGAVLGPAEIQLRTISLAAVAAIVVNETEETPPPGAPVAAPLAVWSASFDRHSAAAVVDPPFPGFDPQFASSGRPRRVTLHSATDLPDVAGGGAAAAGGSASSSLLQLFHQYPAAGAAAGSPRRPPLFSVGPGGASPQPVRPQLGAAPAPAELSPEASELPARSASLSLRRSMVFSPGPAASVALDVEEAAAVVDRPGVPLLLASGAGARRRSSVASPLGRSLRRAGRVAAAVMSGRAPLRSISRAFGRRHSALPARSGDTLSGAAELFAEMVLRRRLIDAAGGAPHDVESVTLRRLVAAAGIPVPPPAGGPAGAATDAAAANIDCAPATAGTVAPAGCVTQCSTDAAAVSAGAGPAQAPTPLSAPFAVLLAPEPTQAAAIAFLHAHPALSAAVYHRAMAVARMPDTEPEEMIAGGRRWWAAVAGEASAAETVAFARQRRLRAVLPMERIVGGQRTTGTLTVARRFTCLLAAALWSAAVASIAGLATFVHMLLVPPPPLAPLARASGLPMLPLAAQMIVFGGIFAVSLSKRATAHLHRNPVLAWVPVGADLMIFIAAWVIFIAVSPGEANIQLEYEAAARETSFTDGTWAALCRFEQREQCHGFSFVCRRDRIPDVIEQIRTDGVTKEPPAPGCSDVCMSWIYAAEKGTPNSGRRSQREPTDRPLPQDAGRRTMLPAVASFYATGAASGPTPAPTTLPSRPTCADTLRAYRTMMETRFSILMSFVLLAASARAGVVFLYCQAVANVVHLA